MNFFNFTNISPPNKIYNYGDGSNIAFSIGGLSIAWYGIFIGLGILISSLFCIYKFRIHKIPIDLFYYFALIGIPTSIIGARIWSCTIGDANWESFWNFRNGGLAIQGGVLLTVIVSLIFFMWVLKFPKFQIRDETNNIPTIKRISIWLIADCVVPTILIGQVIGRWGNYFNQEIYGSIVNDDGLANFLKNVLPRMYIDGNYHQPLFLWEMLLNLVGFFILYVIFETIKNNKFRKCGDLCILYFIWYGIVRFSLEGFREKKYSFALSYVTSGCWIGIGLILLILNRIVFFKLRKYNMFDFIIDTIFNNKRKYNGNIQLAIKNNESMYYYANL